MHVIFVVSAPTACYSRCQRANIMLLCVFSASTSPCIMLLWSPTRQMIACLMLLSSSSSTLCMPLSSAIANDTIASCTEFTQQKIHHDDDDDARHRAAHHHHRPIGPRRAATTVFIPPFGMLRPHHGTASSKCRRRQHLSRRQRQFFSGAVAIAMHLSTRNSSRGVNAADAGAPVNNYSVGGTASAVIIRASSDQIV